MTQERIGLQRFFAEIKLPSEWLSTHFSHVWVERVRVVPCERKWILSLVLAEPIDPEIWREFLRRTHYWEPSIYIEVKKRIDHLSHEIVLQKYKYWIQKQIEKNVSLALAGWFGKADWEIRNQQVWVTLANSQVRKMAFQRKVDRLIERYYAELTGETLPVVLLSPSLSEEEITVTRQEE